jgi:hypothetical protein
LALGAALWGRGGTRYYVSDDSTPDASGKGEGE